MTEMKAHYRPTTFDRILVVSLLTVVVQNLPYVQYQIVGASGTVGNPSFLARTPVEQTLKSGYCSAAMARWKIQRRS